MTNRQAWGILSIGLAFASGWLMGQYYCKSHIVFIDIDEDEDDENVEKPAPAFAGDGTPSYSQPSNEQREAFVRYSGWLEKQSQKEPQNSVENIENDSQHADNQNQAAERLSEPLTAALDGGRVIEGPPSVIYDENEGGFMPNLEDNSVVVHMLDEGYEEIALTYFVDDDLLLDENEEPVGSVTEVLGEDFYKQVTASLDSTIYIQNDRIKTIFEVVVIHGPYGPGHPNE